MASGLPPVPPPAAGHSPWRMWIVTFGAICGSFPIIASAIMAAVAVPSIMGAYGVPQNQAQWASTAYIAANVASQLLNAWATPTLGRRFAYCLAICIFCIGGFAATVAPGIELLIVGRVVQGLAAGVLQGASLVSIVEVFPLHRRRFAVSLFGTGQMLAIGIAPFIGGVVIDTFSWRAVFVAPLAPVVLAFVISLATMPGRQTDQKPIDFDWTGFLLVVISLTCIMATVGNGQRLGWGSLTIIGFAVVSIIAVTLLLARQLNAEAPLIDVGLLRNPRFAGAVALSFMFGLSTFSVNYLIPVFAQAVQGMTPTAAGLLLLPGGLLLMVTTPLAGRIADFVSPRILLAGAFATCGIAALVLSAADVNTPSLVILIVSTFVLVSFGVIQPALGGNMVASVPATRMNAGVGLYNFARQFGGSLGIATTVLVIDIRTAFHADALTATQTSANPYSTELLDKVQRLLHESGVPEAIQRSGALNYLGKVVHAQASTFGYQDAFLCISLAFAVAVVASWLMGRSH